MKPAGLPELLRYPLQFDGALALALFYLIGSVLWFGTAFLGKPEITAENLAIVLDWTSVTFYLAVLFFYGMGIIGKTARGDRTAQPLSLGVLMAQMSNALTQKLGFDFSPLEYRLVAQQLVLMLGVGLLHRLETQGHPAFALAATILFMLVFPATLGVNAIAATILPMFNPLTLLRFMLRIGRVYLWCVLLFLLAGRLFGIAVSGSTLTFHLVLLPALYVTVVLFGTLGEGIFRQHDLFFGAPVDFHAEQKALDESARSNAGFDSMLTQTYDLLRAQQPDKALQRLLEFLHWHHWDDFERVFAYVSAWPFRATVLDLVRHYLPNCLDRKPMRALELCGWCLDADPAFTPATPDILDQLAEHAVTDAQCHCVLRMLDNGMRADAVNRARFLKLSAGIALNKLNDEPRFLQLQQQMESAIAPQRAQE